MPEGRAEDGARRRGPFHELPGESVKDLLRSRSYHCGGGAVVSAPLASSCSATTTPGGTSAGRSATCRRRRRSSARRVPDDANVVNVQDEPYNAKGDGSTDATAALDRAVQDNDCETAVFRSAPKTVYVPAGTYRITDSVAADNCGVRLVGAGQAQTILRLDDSAAGFDNPGDPKIVLQSGNLTSSDPSGTRIPTRIVRHRIQQNLYQHFTLDPAADNPVYHRHPLRVAPSGAMQHVGITTGDDERRGKYGLFFTAAGAGTRAARQHRWLRGGIYLDDRSSNDLMFQDIVLSNQDR